MVPKSFLALALALSAVSTAARSISKRITGGEEAREGEFGSIVTLQSISGHGCAGVLLDSTTVVTAAHCGVHNSSISADYVIKAGTINSEAGGVVSEYVWVASDAGRYLPAEKGGYWPNDIWILKLVTPIEESDTIKYAKLPEYGSDPEINSTAIAAGWGAQGARKALETAKPVSKLHKVTIPIHPRQKCVDIDATAGGRDTIVCAGGDGKNVCKLDSGGPLFDEKTGKLIGIASFVPLDAQGNFCDQAPAVFTRVASYIPWIKENLGGSGGYPYPNFAWIRNATRQIEKHCLRFLNDMDACEIAKRGCLAEVTPGAATQELLECVDRGQVCAEQQGSSGHGQCLEKAKACVKENKIAIGEVDEIEECVKKGL